MHMPAHTHTNIQKANCNEKFIYTFGFPEAHEKIKSKKTPL